MDDYNGARYWAISAVGYGRGFSPGEAESNYAERVAMDFKHLHRVKAKRLEIVRDTFPATVWKSPEEAIGFVLDSQVRWTFADGRRPVAATEEDLV